MAKFMAKDRHYNESEWIPKAYMTALEYMHLMKINPIENKLLSGDEYDLKKKEIVKSSPYRSKLIPGILVTSGNTYGRQKNKLYYKCIPNDKDLPVFLVPYQDKSSSFNKNKLDKYVLFVFEKWNDKHPHGILQQTIGDVSDMSAFEEHQMNCKLINHSIQKFSKHTFKCVKKKSSEVSDIIDDIVKKYKIIDRTHEDVISIDPEGCVDIDDAISVKLDDESPWKTCISVYIANVPLWFDYLDLWDNLDRRVSTVYLTAERRGMLPTILSENLCSLKEGQRRFAISMDIEINGDNISRVDFKNVLVKVKKNYAYDDVKLKEDSTYNEAEIMAKRINKKNNFIDEIADSHDVVQMYMVLMNNYIGKTLKDKLKKGVFRSFKAAAIDEKMNIPSELKSFARTWKSSGGIYTLDNKGHDMMNSVIDVYAHATSPIRRLVDLINMTLMNVYDGKIGDKGMHFAMRWFEKIDYINSQMKAIRKVQNDVKLLSICLGIEDLSDKRYRGYIIDREEVDSEYKYTVMLKDLSCISTFKTKDKYDLYDSSEYSLHIFNDEYNLKQKIRIHRL
uniref:RNB domain-containing protein n=1 Tax=viral metagenome TaxID=1070528 RepID=A0A6C0CR74_9ZZZZ